MRSSARLRSPLIVVILLAAFVAIARCDNVCDCQSPPGGTVRCEQGQVAICRIRNGQVIAECKTPPRNAQSGEALKLWLASELVGKKLAPADLELGYVKDALQTGRVRTPSGEVATFRFSDHKREMAF
jgi:hypothetical protein